MKKKTIITLLTICCIGICGCTGQGITSDTDGNSKTNTSMESDITSETSTDISNESTKYEAYIAKDNKKIRYYFYLDESSQNAFDEVHVDVLVNNRTVKTVNIPHAEAGNTYYFYLDQNLLSGAGNFTVEYTFGRLTTPSIVREYSVESNSLFHFVVKADGEDFGGVLAEGADHLGTFVDTQGTSDVYSTLTISRKESESHCVDDTPADVEISLYRTMVLKGKAVSMGDTFRFESTEDSAQVSGDIIVDEFDCSATFSVTKSNIDLIPEGAKYEFSNNIYDLIK